jgi:altronate dehydratase small subunit
MQTAFQIGRDDNVATALTELQEGQVQLNADASVATLSAREHIPVGHKIALQDIEAGEKIVKYSVVIGEATVSIKAGSWVHLHCMKSCYDERSSHLDIHTGAPTDIEYT